MNINPKIINLLQNLYLIMKENLFDHVDNIQIKDPKSPDYGAFGKSKGFESSQLIWGLLKYFDETKDEKFLESAKICADWYVRTQIKRKQSIMDGTWYDPAYGKNIIIFPEVIEILGGICDVYELTKEDRYLKCIKRGYRPFQRARVKPTSRWNVDSILSRIYMDYDVKEKKMSSCMHRAIDDGIDYRYFKITGDKKALKEFKNLCDYQMKIQTDDGGFYETYYSPHHNVIMVCGARWSLYWATMPYLYAYDEFKEKNYLKVVEKSCRWLVENQRKDGSFWSWYYPNGEPAHDSIDPCSAGVAVFLWSEFGKRTGTKKFLPYMVKSIKNLVSIKTHGVRILAFLCRAYYSLKGQEHK